MTVEITPSEDVTPEPDRLTEYRDFYVGLWWYDEEEKWYLLDRLFFTADAAMMEATHAAEHGRVIKVTLPCPVEAAE